MQPVVRQAISVLHERYFDPITINSLASEVYLSPFHFSRVFARETGMTPGRYLTTVRMFEAKRLLLTTSLTVSDVVCSVGYSSVGTFTSRFTRVVGITPTQYRDPEVAELLLAVSPQFQRLPSLTALRDAGKNCVNPMGTGEGTVDVHVELPPGTPTGTVLVGAFAEAVPQRAPVAYTGAPDGTSAHFTLRNVPSGTWHVLAAAENLGGGGEPASLMRGNVATPVTVRGAEHVSVHLRMRRLLPTDAPIAITLASRYEAATPARTPAPVRHLQAVA